MQVPSNEEGPPIPGPTGSNMDVVVQMAGFLALTLSYAAATSQENLETMTFDTFLRYHDQLARTTSYYRESSNERIMTVLKSMLSKKSLVTIVFMIFIVFLVDNWTSWFILLAFLLSKIVIFVIHILILTPFIVDKVKSQAYKTDLRMTTEQIHYLLDIEKPHYANLATRVTKVLLFISLVILSFVSQIKLVYYLSPAFQYATLVLPIVAISVAVLIAKRHPDLPKIFPVIFAFISTMVFYFY